MILNPDLRERLWPYMGGIAKQNGMIPNTNFQEEYLAFLKKHGTHFDEKYLWISYARSYRTLWDGSFEGRFPRHFVPDYDRCCPYGTRRQTFGNRL